MKNLSLPQIADSIFAAICSFLLFFTAVRYYVKNLILAIILGIVAGVLFGLLTFLYLGKKRGKKLLSAKDERNKGLLAIHLSLSKPKENNAMFSTLFNVEENSNANVSNQICGADKIYFLHFSLENLKSDDIANAIKCDSQKKKIILCNNVSAEGKKLADNFLIEILTLDELYPMLKDKNLLPEKYIFEGESKPNILKRIKAKFNKKLTSPLFFCGLWLLLFSYFTFYPVYYIVVGGILLVLSSLSLIIGN
jgi:hypothetical protein